MQSNCFNFLVYQEKHISTMAFERSISQFCKTKEFLRGTKKKSKQIHKQNPQSTLYFNLLAFSYQFLCSTSKVVYKIIKPFSSDVCCKPNLPQIHADQLVGRQLFAPNALSPETVLTTAATLQRNIILKINKYSTEDLSNQPYKALKYIPVNHKSLATIC